MKSIDIPAKFSIPWGVGADPSNITAVPVEPNGTPGAASLRLGWGPETQKPIAAGGTAPIGQYENGIHNQETAWLRWAGAGAPVAYDPAFQTAIGGYPNGAQIMSATNAGVFWYSTADDNVTNPDAAGAGWIGYTPIPLYAADTGTKNAIVVAFAADAAAFSYFVGKPMQIKKMGTANDGNVTIKMNAFGTAPLLHPDGSQIAAAELVGGGMLTVVLDPAGNFELMSGGGVTQKQLQVQAGNYAVDQSTDPNAIAIALSPAPVNVGALLGVRITITKNNLTSTGDVTVAVNGIAAQHVRYGNYTVNPSVATNSLAQGEIPASSTFTIVHDGTAFVLEGKIRRAYVNRPFYLLAASFGNLTYTLGLESVGMCIRCDGLGSPANITIPPSSSVDFPTGGDLYHIFGYSASVVNIIRGAGVSLFLTRDASQTSANRAIGTGGYAMLFRTQGGADTWAIVDMGRVS